MDELVVAHAVQLGSGADAHDPQRPVLALFLAASGISELQAALHRLLRRPVQLRFCQVITAGAVKYFFAFGAAFGPAFYTRHVVLLFCFLFSGWRQDVPLHSLYHDSRRPGRPRPGGRAMLARNLAELRSAGRVKAPVLT